MTTFYEEIGGFETFRRIVAKFYEGVATDPVLRPLYPEEDLGPAEGRLLYFLVQYWGGPTTYLEERGHPRLRARHFPFPIGEAARDRWLFHMRAAIDASDAGPAERAELHEYMTLAADMMRNVDEPAAGD